MIKDVEEQHPPPPHPGKRITFMLSEISHHCGTVFANTHAQYVYRVNRIRICEFWTTFSKV